MNCYAEDSICILELHDMPMIDDEFSTLYNPFPTQMFMAM